MFLMGFVDAILIIFPSFSQEGGWLPARVASFRLALQCCLMKPHLLQRIVIALLTGCRLFVCFPCLDVSWCISSTRRLDSVSTITIANV